MTLEQEAEELLIRARADYFAACNGRQPNSCLEEHKDDVKSLRAYYKAECARFEPYFGASVLANFCDDLDDLFDDNKDELDVSAQQFAVLESARRRYDMICARWLSPKRCHDEEQHRLEQAEDDYQKYCENFITKSSFNGNETLASAARHDCRARVEKVFDRHMEIFNGEDAAYYLTNRRVIVWLAQVKNLIFF